MPLVFLVLGSVGAIAPWRRLPGWAVPSVLALVALATGVVPISVGRTAFHDLAPALAFLLVAVPLAVLLDHTGFFAAVAAMFDGGRHLFLALWLIAAGTTIVFNLDAAVVLLTPLFVRIAERRSLDPVAFGAIPAVLASLASSVLPVSNLTNLIVAGRLELTALDFLTHLALPSAVAIGVGGVLHRRLATHDGPGVRVDEPVDRRALRIGVPVVIWLLLGFTLGDRLGVPAWVVAAIALVGLAVCVRDLPRHAVPFGAAALAAGLGVLAAGAASHLPVEELLAVDGARGEALTIGVFALGANAVNNLPALLLALPALDLHPDRVWAVLLGVNLGPTLWVTGALSTLLWQSTMRRLGHTVTATGYARIALRSGAPAMVAAVVAHLLALALR